MTWKKVNNADPGTADTFGGDDTDKISDAFSGTDVDDIDMNCDFTLRSGKGHIRNPGNTFSYNLVGGAIAANRNINYPVLTADDTPTFNATSGTLSNKTIELEDNTLKLRDHTRVFKDGSTYYAINSAGSIISSGSVAETVIQAAIDGGSTTFIAGATYSFSGGFTGLNITSSAKRIIMSPSAILEVPNGYSGHVIKLEGSIMNVHIQGGDMTEAGSALKLWKGVHIKSTGSSNAIKHCKFEFMKIGACGWMFYLEVTAVDGFINSMEFNNIWGYYPIIGFEWVNSGGGSDPFLHNHYYNIDIQANADTLYGFKNVMTRSPVFVGCEVQDMDSTDTQMLIHSSCGDTVIIGGSLNSGGSTGLFTDNGTNTFIMARGTNTTVGRGLTFADGKNMVVGTSSGTKIGTSTSQKLGFYNKTPIVQPAANADTSGASLAALETEVNQLKQTLRDLGLIAT